MSAQIAFTNKTGISLGVRIFSGFVTFFLFGFMIYFWYFEWVRYKEHYVGSTTSNVSSDNEQKSFYLSKHYSRQIYWFWTIRLITSSVRGVVLAFLAIHPITQTVLVVCTFCVYFACHFVYRPYEDNVMNVVHGFNLICTIVYHVFFILFSTYEAIEQFGNVTWIMIGLQLSITMSSFFVTIRGFIKSRASKASSK